MRRTCSGVGTKICAVAVGGRVVLNPETTQKYKINLYWKDDDDVRPGSSSLRLQESGGTSLISPPPGKWRPDEPGSSSSLRFPGGGGIREVPTKEG